MSVVWITGLPGSGKTTFSRYISTKLNLTGPRPIFLDGDELRRTLHDLFGYDRRSRIELGKFYVNLASLLSQQGHVVLISTVSLFREVHEYRTKIIPKCILVVIDAEKDLLDLRNQKNLRGDNVVLSPGISLSIEFPTNSDFVLRGDESPRELEDVFQKLQDLLK